MVVPFSDFFIYNYFTGRLMEFYFTKVSQDHLPTKHSERSEGYFVGKNVPGKPWLSKINLIEVFVHNFIVY